MSSATSVALAAIVASVLTLALTPVAIAVARRTAFLDHPIGYKGHGAPTPYLGGAAVVVAFLVAASFADPASLWPILAGAAILLAVGTVDDRRPLPAALRVAIEVGLAVLLWARDLGWEATGVGWIDLLLTAVWIVGVVNAFNLLDNIDGAAGTIALVCALGLAALAALHDLSGPAALAAALAGACGAFLFFNLARPARIFLGDGGSMPIGFVLAALAIAATGSSDATTLLGAIPLVGLAVLDTTLVVVSRTRRGVSILTGGRDHLTHRLLRRLASPARVAGLLAAVQAVLSGLAIVAFELGDAVVVALGLGFAASVGLAIAVLETAHWAPQSS